VQPAQLSVLLGRQTSGHTGVIGTCDSEIDRSWVRFA
jgi:hypothetical protein